MINRSMFFLLLLVCGFSRVAFAVTASDFGAAYYTDIAADGTTPYRFYVPAAYSASTKYPLVLFLHGVGENGSDNVAQLNNRANGAMVFAEQANNPAFMIAPQNWNGASGWANNTLRRHILGIIQKFQADYNIDPLRIYVIGLSNGGAGTWDELNTYPWLYAAGVPASGWGSATDAIKNIPAWCFHCADDPTVNVSGGDNIIAGLRNLGGNPIYTRFDTGGHGSWVMAYQTQEMIDWMFTQRRGQRDWTILPSLKITSPTGNKGYQTSATTLNISGTATDMLLADTTTTGITFVTWTNTHGSTTDTGNATGDTSWSVDGIALASGTNRIRVLATGTSYHATNGGNTTFTDVIYVNSTATPDTTAPVITISTPATSPITVTTALYTMAASVSDTGGVVDWTWSSSNGFTGTCQSTWPVPLLAGNNVITVTAVDAAGNSSSKSVTIVYTPLTGNQPPVVSAGLAQAILLPTNSVTLAGTATDDSGKAPTVTWSKLSGPGTVTFSNAASLTSNATFSIAGTYVLQLSANDGQLTSTDTVAVVVGYKRWLFDFGATGTTTTGGWNNITNLASGTSLSAAIDSTGAASGVNLAITAGFTGINSNGTTQATLYPATAQEDSFYVQGTTVAGLKLTGLNPTGVYQFTFFASRLTLDDRTTDYTIGTNKVTLDPVDNTTRSVYIANVVPDSTGAVSFTVDADNGTGYGYLGVLDIIQLNNPGSGGSDTTPPAISIISPTTSANYATTSATLNLAGTASDNVGVTLVSWSNNKGGSGTANGTTSWTISNIALVAGANVITVTARDAAGNSTNATLTVTYTATTTDTTPPTVAISTPTSGATYTATAATLNLAGSASDNVGVTQVTWSSDRGASGTATGTTSWTISNIAMSSGQNVITVSAKDAAGNTGKTTLTVTYTPPDTTPPTVIITTPAASGSFVTRTGSVSLGGTASDNVGVTLVSWSNNLGGSGNATGTATWTVSNIVLQTGLNIITVTAKDAAGNAGSAVLKVTYMPNHVPTVDSAASVQFNPVLINDIDTFTAAASDADGDTLTYAWTFGDGAGGSGANATHSYAAAGMYTATVTITDGFGGSASSVVNVTVISPVSVKVNFQLAGGPVPSGYLSDTGAVFADRGNGFSYGWNVDSSVNARDRNAANSPDQRYDTLIHMQKPNAPTAAWEIALPNGTYSVRAVCGDPSYFDSTYKLNVEGVLTVNATPTATTKWFEGTQAVQVSDGRLTVSSATGAVNNKICFIEISSASQATRDVAFDAPPADPLNINKLQIKLNFAHSGTDSYAVSGSFASLPSGSLAGTTVSVDVGAAIVDFVLDAKGHAKNKNGILKITKSKTKGAIFQALVKGGNWLSDWADGGLTNATVKSAKYELPVTLTVAGHVYGGSKTVTYSAKAKRGGAGR